MAFPVTLNGRTYTLTDFEGTNYVDGLPDAFEDFVTHAGDIYNSTSTTSNSIGTGSKTFTVEANKPYQAGTPLRIADAAAPSTNFLDTVVTSYSGTTLVVNSIGFGGSGTKTSWTVNIGGAKTVDGTLGLSQGGTGANDAAGARTNIDVYSKADADSRFLNVSGEASAVTISGNLSVDGGTIKLDGNYPTGTQNTALGDAALDDGSLSGGFNTAIGRASLSDNTSGSYNSALGNGSLQDNETGTANTAVGYNALTSNTASYNVAVGHQALEDNTSGNYLTAVGQAALGNNTSGIRNSALGRATLGANTTGNYNSAFGYGALDQNETHSHNTAMGYLALTAATADNNTAVGYEAGYTNTTGNNLSALGFRAGYSMTSGGENTFIGRDSGYGTTSGYRNTFLGYYSGRNVNIGHTNTFVGNLAGEDMSSGSKNVIIGGFNGNQGDLDIRTSNNYIVLSDGDGNPRLQISQYGELAAKGQQTTSAAFNTSYSGGDGRRCLLWHQAGASTGRPRMLLESHTSGGVIEVNNTFNSSSTRSFLRFYRRGVLVGRIEGNDTTTTYVTSSDYRLKENVIELTGATDRLKQLDPKRFNFIADADTTVDGFLAHEVQSVVPEAITGTHNEVETWEEEDDLPDGVSLGDNKLDENGNTIPKYQGIDQSKLVPLLVATIKELEARITALENA